ncbi:MAG: dienelactone hydrolase family protein [Acidobacteria bacterium]|jgi:predicted esterase|nr:dienelactone hydrolase family protein [Acidobacteriota bacterium]
MNSENLQTDLSVKTEIKLYYDLYIPENLKKPAPLLIAVHGYGAHKRYMMREAFVIAPENCVIVSIQAPHQHFRQTDNDYKIGFGWLTDYKSEESVSLHHNFILEIIAKLAGKEIIDADKVFLYGFSQACALNFRFAFTFPDAVCGVIGVCGGIPSDLETNALYKPTNADVFYLYGSDDEFYPLGKFQTFEQKLKDYLPNFQASLYQAKHEITDEMREDVRKWLMVNG